MDSSLRLLFFCVGKWTFNGTNNDQKYFVSGGVRK